MAADRRTGNARSRRADAGSGPRFTIGPTAPEDRALLHFTSGNTGKPKGAIHVHEAVVAHHATGALALDFHSTDVFWCTADPGWITGTSQDRRSFHARHHQHRRRGDFDAERWYRILGEQQVSVWHTAPTAVRMMMKAARRLARRHDFPRLRFIASVGEPLNPQAVLWGAMRSVPIHDNWWQTETGGIMIATTRRWTSSPADGQAAPVSMPRSSSALPTWRAEVIAAPDTSEPRWKWLAVDVPRLLNDDERIASVLPASGT